MGVRCPPTFPLSHIHEPSCPALVPELIDEELYLEVGRGAGGGPLPRPPIGRLRLSSPLVGGSRSPVPARIGSSLFSDSVSEAVDGSELGPKKHRKLNQVTPPNPRIHHCPQTGRLLLLTHQPPSQLSSPSPFPQASTQTFASPHKPHRSPPSPTAFLP